jgi:DNA-binding HxlR family transcriptional regulator
MLQHIAFARILIDRVLPPGRNTRWRLKGRQAPDFIGHRFSRKRHPLSHDADFSRQGAMRSRTATKDAKTRAVPTGGTAAGEGRTRFLQEENSSIVRAAAILADAWSFLIIREAFFGARRFETFRTALGMTRATLTSRLRMLTHKGIFRQASVGTGSTRLEYRLTTAGLDLYPTFIAQMQFGDRWLASEDGPPLTLMHQACNKVTRPYVACSECKEEVTLESVTFRAGPGAGWSRAAATRRTRRLSDSSQFERGRPSAVSRTLQLIGDRWSFLILWEAYFGNTRFDELQGRLGIASNILADRLVRLVEKGIFVRQLYQDTPERHEYLLTKMGRALFGSTIVMMSWGDRWLSSNNPPLILTHEKCGREFTPVVICNKCLEPVNAHNMKYRLRYDPKQFGVDNDDERKAPGRLV